MLFIARISMGFQFQSVASVSPFLIADLSLNYAQIGTLIGLYMLPGVVIALPGGFLGKRFGDKRVCGTGLALMVAGGVVLGVSQSFTVAFVGRLVSGIGAVVFNIVLTTMVTDWFAGKEIITAMGVVATSWPLGVALALMTQSAAASTYSWPAVMHFTALVCAVAFGLVIALYQRPPSLPEDQVETGISFRVPRRELLPVSMAGLTWGFLNVGLVLFFSFSPGLLTAQGMSAIDAGAVVSIGLWVSLLSIPLGGYLIERLGRPKAAIAILSGIAGAAMLASPYLSVPVILSVVVGLGIGAAGPIVALPSQALAPQNRGPGLGVFFTWYYGAMAAGPFFAGLGQDLTGSPAVPMIIGGAAFMATAAFVGLFHLFLVKSPAKASLVG